MNPFEIKENIDDLRDANGKRIEVPPVPTAEMLERLIVQTINESTTEKLSIISNIDDEVEEDIEEWKFSDCPDEVTKLTIERIMIELTGESWFGWDKEDGYSIGDMIELLSKKAFVQFSELTIANIKACLNDHNGKVIAYFPDLVWREHFNQLPSLPSEVLGMRTIEIVKMIDHDGMMINDLSSPEGRNKLLDKTSFDWLSKGGWMLEVYK